MSYSCLRDYADERYHALCRHDCCGDKECERRNRRWWGQATYSNGCSIASSDSGIYTTEWLMRMDVLGIPRPNAGDMYSLDGKRVRGGRVNLAPLDVLVYEGQGMVRPWSHVALCFIVLSFLCGVVQ